MEPKSLVDLALEAIKLKDLKKARPEMIKVVSENLVSVCCKTDSLFKEGLEFVRFHVCVFDRFNTWCGNGRPFRKAARCNCPCERAGSLCKCSCGALVKKLIEFKIASHKKYWQGEYDINGNMSIGDIINDNFNYIERTGFSRRKLYPV